MDDTEWDGEDRVDTSRHLGYRSLYINDGQYEA